MFTISMLYVYNKCYIQIFYNMHTSYMSHDYTPISLKTDVATKLKDLSKLEKHTLSDQLDIIIEFYALKKELN